MSLSTGRPGLLSQFESLASNGIQNKCQSSARQQRLEYIYPGNAAGAFMPTMNEILKVLVTPIPLERKGFRFGRLPCKIPKDDLEGRLVMEDVGRHGCRSVSQPCLP